MGRRYFFFAPGEGEAFGLLTISTQKFFTRSALETKRGSAPQTGDPIALSHDVHCFSSRGEIAA